MSDVQETSKNLEICSAVIPDAANVQKTKSGKKLGIKNDEDKNVIISNLKSTKVRYNKEDGCYVRITDNGETIKSKPVSKQKIDYYLKALKQKTKNKEDNDITKE